MSLNPDDLKKSVIGLVAVAIVATAVFFVIRGNYFKNDAQQVFDEVNHAADIKGTIEDWEVSGKTVTTFIEVTPGNARRYVLTFDKNTKYRYAKTPDIQARTLVDGKFEYIRTSRTVEIFLVSPPYNGDKQNVVETIIYW